MRGRGGFERHSAAAYGFAFTCSGDASRMRKRLSGSLAWFSHDSLGRHFKLLLTPTSVPLLFPGIDWIGLPGVQGVLRPSAGMPVGPK